MQTLRNRRRYMGEARDHLVDRAKTMARETADRVQRVTEEAGRTLKDAAQKDSQEEHEMADQKLDQLKQKYQPVLNIIQQTGVRLSHLHVQDNKLFMQGEAPSEHAKNQVWDEIKRVDPSYSDLTCELTVNASLAQAGGQQAAQQTGAAAGGGMQTYTVKPGDSLSKISQQFYGNAGEYMKIFEANRDQLSDPNRIQPGQTLKIPK